MKTFAAWTALVLPLSSVLVYQTVLPEAWLSYAFMLVYTGTVAAVTMALLFYTLLPGTEEAEDR